MMIQQEVDKISVVIAILRLHVIVEYSLKSF